MVEVARDLRTGIALANPSDTESSDVTVTLSDKTGRETGRTHIVLAPLNHTSGRLEQYFTGLGKLEGAIDLVASKPVIAVTLRSDNAMLTTVPVIPTK